ncbi:MAG: hypothetical protein ABIK73_00400 [candidate division WOR-3 bacterium]
MLAEASRILKELQRLRYWPKLFVLVGPSGVGKTSLCRLAVKTRGNLSYAISATTRAPRPGERDGQDYYFLSLEEFLAKKARGEFIETTRIYNSYYGLLRHELEGKLQKGQSVIMDLDIRGLIHLKAYYRAQAVGIFILPPSIKELHKRYLARREARDENPAVRLYALSAELGWLKQELSRPKPRVDYVLINKELGASVQNLIQLIKHEEQRIIGGGKV